MPGVELACNPDAVHSIGAAIAALVSGIGVRMKRVELNLETPSVQVIACVAPVYNYFYSKMPGWPGRRPQTMGFK